MAIHKMESEPEELELEHKVGDSLGAARGIDFEDLGHFDREGAHNDEIAQKLAHQHRQARHRYND